MKLRCKAHLAINLLVGTANTGQQLRLSEKKSFTLHHTRDFAQGPGSCFSPPARWGLLDFMSVACSSPPLLSSSPLLLLLLNRDPRRTVFSVGPQPRPSTPSVPCRTSTTTIPAQCSLPDLNHDHPRPVFPAGPQPRVSTPSVPCRTSTWDLPSSVCTAGLQRPDRM